jgi:uncharacterized protein (TIGR02453 family)
MATFDGFSSSTLRFLRGVSKNNDKKWFDAHRSDYEQHWLEPAKAFVETVEPRLAKIAPGVHAEPRVNGSIFRINRDTRFSKDKTPYKDHLDFWFWEGDRKLASSGLFLRITPKTWVIGAGTHAFDKAHLGAYGDAVADSKRGAALVRVAKQLARAGYEVKGEQYKKTPRGYEATSDRERFLRYGALWAAEEGKLPGSLGSKGFVADCEKRWKKLVPLHRWLVDSL